MGGNYYIKHVLDLSTVLVEHETTGKMLRLSIKELAPITDKRDKPLVRDIADIPDDDWKEAERRYAIILPVLQNRGNSDIVTEVSIQNNVSVATLYRWLNRYDQTENKSSLVPALNNRGKGFGRLPEEIEAIIKGSIEDVYLTKQKKSLRKVCLEVIARCKTAKLKPPHANTIRNRINFLSEELKLQFRSGKPAAAEKFEPHKGGFPGADHPLAVVQIDHTKLDILVVDKEHRLPVGRPWITLAMDIHSRVVLGFYISFDPPGALAVGMAICNSILPKEMLLDRLNVTGEWPCYGIMRTIHADNAKEFRGQTLLRACSEYNIQLNWRPVKKPHWGGHIERILGTFLKELHELPGTTFSNPKNRKYYDSGKEAVFTIEELEQWLTTFIINVYHEKIHSGIGQSPIHKWKTGLLGSDTQIAMGIPKRISDERKLRLDFLPFEERTVQEYGVLIDYIYYYHDVLRKWVNSLEPGNLKSKRRRKFIFKRDPRDISVINFFDPDLKEYFPIPYKNTALPPISIWEFNEVIRKLKDQNVQDIDEAKIFQAYQKLKFMEEQAISKKEVAKRNARATKRKHSIATKAVTESVIENRNLKFVPEDQINDLFQSGDIKPFEELEHGTLN